MQFSVTFSTAVVFLLASKAIAAPLDDPTSALPTGDLPTGDLPTSGLPTDGLTGLLDPLKNLGTREAEAGSIANSYGNWGSGNNYGGKNWGYSNKQQDSCPPVAVSKPTTNTDSSNQQANNCSTGTPYCCDADGKGGNVCTAGETDCKATTICCNNSNGYQICAGEVNFNNPVTINLNFN